MTLPRSPLGSRWQRLVALSAASAAFLGIAPSSPAYAFSAPDAVTSAADAAVRPSVSDLTAVQGIHQSDALSFTAKWNSNGADWFDFFVLRSEPDGLHLQSSGTRRANGDGDGTETLTRFVPAGTYRLQIAPAASEDGPRGQTVSVDVIVARPQAPELLYDGTVSDEHSTWFAVEWKSAQTHPARTIKMYYVLVDGDRVAGAPARNVNAQGNYEASFKLPSPGLHTIQIVAQDNYDNRSEPTTIAVIFRNPAAAAPVVTSRPLARDATTPRITTQTGQKVGSRVTVRWSHRTKLTGAPAKVVGYQVRVSRVRWISVPASKRSLNLAVRKGHHTVCVRAVYARGVSGADCISLRR